MLMEWSTLCNVWAGRWGTTLRNQLLRKLNTICIIYIMTPLVMLATVIILRLL